MRLLMLSWRYVDNPQSGGAEVLTHEVLRRLVTRGHTVSCFTAEHPGPAPEELDGVRIIRAGQQWSVHVQAWRWLRTRLRDYDVIVDQINTIPFLTPRYVPSGQRVLFICQLARGYWFRETRGLFRLLAPAGYLAEPSLMRMYRHTPTITISPSSKADLVRLGFPPDQVSIIPMALTTPRFESLEPKQDPFRVIILGRLTPAKFVEEGIQAFARFQRERPDAVLDIVGSGDPRYRRRLDRLVHGLGITGVTFHGRVDEPRKRQLLAQAHLHVFTSHREGWGLTVSEAAAVGTPSVGYDVPGVRDSIDEPLLLAPCGRVDALAARLAAVAADPGVYADVRDASWRRTMSMSYDDTSLAFEEAITRSAYTREAVRSVVSPASPAREGRSQ